MTIEQMTMLQQLSLDDGAVDQLLVEASLVISYLAGFYFKSL